MDPISGAEQMLFATVRIETEYSNGAGVGTAFLFGIFSDGHETAFLVTNKHVVESAIRGSFFFTRERGGIPAIGERIEVTLPDFASLWHGHPDPDVDISVLPLDLVDEILQRRGDDVYIKILPDEMIPTDDDLSQLSAIEEIMFFGYPIGIYDEKNLMPVARRGISATSLGLDYNGRAEFLIDASVFPGSSGSPVMFIQHGPLVNRLGTMIVGGSRSYLLGIIKEVLCRRETGEIRFEPAPTGLRSFVDYWETIDLGVVQKSHCIREAALDYLNSSEEPKSP